LSSNDLHHELRDRAGNARRWAGRHGGDDSRMIATIGGIALAAALARNKFMGLLARTERWRHGAETALEVGSSVMVLVFGLWMTLRALST
jgi:hypothetical protein